MSYKNSFIRIKDLKERIKTGNYTLCAFGVSKANCVYLDSLEYENIHIDYFVDNDIERQGTFMYSKQIISPQELTTITNPIVVIVSSYTVDIYEQLEELGIKDVYEISDINAVCTKGMICNDVRIKNEYIGESSEKVLVNVGDGFGDNIIKFPLLEELSRMEDIDNYYFLVDRQSTYDIYSSLFKNVKMFNNHRFYFEPKYREKMLRYINQMHFKLGICFCATVYFHTHCDPFNKYNTNIPEFKSFYECLEWENGRNKETITENMQIMGKEVFGFEKNLDLSKKGAFNHVLKDVILEEEISQSYVVLAMGGISWTHVYEAEKIASVADFFAELGNRIVLLGYGNADEEYYLNLIDCCKNKSAIINLTSRLSVFESLKIIEKASLFIGLDSALAHGAYALDKNAIVLMSGNNFSRKFMHKNDNKMIYLTGDVDCIGCNQCQYGDYNQQKDKRGYCIKMISEQSIIEAGKHLLDM